MTKKLIHSALAVAMSVALACPQAVQAAHAKAMVVDGIQVSTTVKDLAMHQGTIHGALVDANGKPLAGQPAVIAQQGKTLAVKATDEAGRYSFENLTPGVYQVATHAGIQTFRVWDATEAPATADKGIIQVAGDDVVRGSCGCSDPGCDGGGCDAYGGGHHRGGFGGKLKGALANPNVAVLGAAAIAAAIAIPLALDDDDDAS
ncbi:carboxypeptidase-like regulatory domain-containing protein [Roseimaritima sediminicola]|uniref:carboxypeptidase-like regulatory domain-containing protein n=1 Tax=Roseimaritima sediminicola TaxID=2662066 RepID=UPI0012982C48|nr:carboxypeptidase-like regulatory domain-containing protein [Roseimaritima sediminicola]